MRDAAGELPQRLEPLAVLQRLLGFLPPFGLEIQPARPSQRRGEQDEQKRGGRCAEDQMLAYRGEPAPADRRRLEPG